MSPLSSPWINEPREFYGELRAIREIAGNARIHVNRIEYRNRELVSAKCQRGYRSFVVIVPRSSLQCDSCSEVELRLLFWR